MNVREAIPVMIVLLAWAPLKVQQELMRHADIRTTMNIYGKAMEKSKRGVHGEMHRQNSSVFKKKDW